MGDFPGRDHRVFLRFHLGYRVKNNMTGAWNMLCKVFLYFSSKKTIIFLKHEDSTSLTICKTYFKTILFWSLFGLRLKKSALVGTFQHSSAHSRGWLQSRSQYLQNGFNSVHFNYTSQESFKYVYLYVLSQVLLTHHLDCHSHAHVQKEDKAETVFFYILTMKRLGLFLLPLNLPTEWGSMQQHSATLGDSPGER